MWTGRQFADRHHHALQDAPAQATAAARQANAVLKATGDEGLAIAVANKHADKVAAEKKRSRANRLYGKRKVVD